MSHVIEETYDVYREQLRCARWPHTCNACQETIAKGQRYYVVSWVFERSAGGVKRCARCQAIHEHLRDLEPGELWPDERLNCGEEYREHWGVEPPPEIAALAFALPGEVR